MTLNTAQATAQIMTTFIERLDAILDRPVHNGQWMLMWKDAGCLMVRLVDGKANATGFEHATTFPDRATAVRWGRQIRNGMHQHPEVMSMSEAKFAARKELIKVMKHVAEACGKLPA